MPQLPAIAGHPQDIMTTELTQLRARAGDLKLRASDLEVQKGQLGDRRRSLGADVDKTAIDKQLADVEHDLAATRIQLEITGKQIEELETARDMSRVGITVVPPPQPSDMDLMRERERMVGLGALIVLLPLVLALSRRLWHRGGPRPVVDLENSPRLQRMEQAIESIAVEVERIGEAQRFTTKLLTERHGDAAARLPTSARREPGTITPH
jgi:hypothetical protein